MRTTLVSLGLATLAISALPACRDTTPPPAADLGVRDMTATPVDMPMMMTATLHDIETDVVGDKTQVTVTGVVVTGIANGNGHSENGKMYCRYYAFLQDPNGQAPCAIKLYASGDPCTETDAGKCTCEYPPKSNTPLDAITTLGDIFTISGAVSDYAPSSDAGLAGETHELDVTKGSVTKTGSGGMIVPVVAANPSDFTCTQGGCTSDAIGFTNYESMVVTITPAMASTASMHDKYGGWDFGNAHFSSDYDFVWGMKGAFPAANMALKSITGVADADYGGGIAPRTSADFQ